MLSHFQPGTHGTYDNYTSVLQDHSRIDSSAIIPVSASHYPMTYSSEIQPQLFAESSTFEQFSRSTQRQLEEMQQRTEESMSCHQNWLYHQCPCPQQPSTFMPCTSLLTTPTLVVHYPPVTRVIDSYQHERLHALACYDNMFARHYYD
jgi:hypothetical protein